jgi:hypothetical protein
VQTCLKARSLFRENRSACICLGAGHWPRNKKIVGIDVMKEFLLKAGVPSANIGCTSDRNVFRTIGEVRGFVDMLKDEILDDEFICAHEVYLVARWWHLPRIWALFAHARTKEIRDRTIVHLIPVFPVFLTELFDMGLEPLKWGWAFLRREV